MAFEFSKFPISVFVDCVFKTLILLSDFHLIFEVELWNQNIPRQAVTTNVVFWKRYSDFIVDYIKELYIIWTIWYGIPLLDKYQLIFTCMISFWLHGHCVTTNPVLNEMPDNLSVENVQTDEKEVISRSCEIQRIGSK